MLKIENYEVVGWEHAIRGMRNPMNSWEQSDSCWSYDMITKKPDLVTVDDDLLMDVQYDGDGSFVIGPNDQKLMMNLRNAGTDHRKFMRMLTVYVDITAPLYWWKEFDTYKVGTVANSCSTMHKIHAKRFAIDDFSHEHLCELSMKNLEDIVEVLNKCRDLYLGFDGFKHEVGDRTQKDYWWQMIQLLPSSYNQKRTVMLNYEVLANIYKSRKNHKLDEWHVLCEWIEKLPYSGLITGA